MKFFHLSDLHIGLKLLDRDLREDQEYIFREIARYAKEEAPDAIVIAGDVYDKSVPPAEAYELFDYFLNLLREAAPDAKIMMISGNHDSAIRVNTYRNVLCNQNIYMIGMPPVREEEYIEKVVLEDSFGPVNFYLLPFVKPSMVKMIVGTDDNGNNFSYNETIRRMIEREQVNTCERNVLVSHQFYLPEGKNPDDVERMDSEICTVGNIDQVSAKILEVFDYAALGHIHKPMCVGNSRFRYCGTPLACSVSESEQDKGIVVVEMGAKGNTDIRVLPLKPMRKVRILTGTLQEVLTLACDDYVSVVLTDTKELDVMDMHQRLTYAFPNLLNIQRKNQRGLQYKKEGREITVVDPYDLCMRLLGDLSEDEQELLRDVINTVDEEET